MAVQPFSPVQLQSGGGERINFTWTLANGDTGAPYTIPNNYDATVHIYGTFGAAGSVTVYGSNNIADYTTNAAGAGSWIALTDPQGNALTKTSASIEAILEQPLYIAPKVTAGDGTTSIVVNVILRRKGLN